MAAALVEPTLQELAQTAPYMYTQKSSGIRTVRNLYQKCRQQKLTTVEATSDVVALHAVFDVALSKGLGCLILDYVQEVCLNSTLVSSDPVDAALLDGNTVHRWCVAALDQSKNNVVQQLTAVSLERLQTSSSAVLQYELGRTSVLLLIIKALSQPGSSESHMTELLTEATCLHQLLQALEWAGGQQLTSHTGRFASLADWRSTVNKRNQAASNRQTQPFLQDLLDQIATDSAREGQAIISYPPERLSDFVQGLFLTGKADTAAWHSKLQLFLYALLDRQGGVAGQKIDLASFRDAFDLQRSGVEEWYSQFLLDDALIQAGQASLDTACTILPGVAGTFFAAGTSSRCYKLVTRLASLQCPHTALSLLHARGQSSAASQEASETTFEEAKMALGIRLQCGVFTEACYEMRAYCERLSPDKKAEHTAILVVQLCKWAAAASQMQDVIKLPLDGLEEQVLVKWFSEQGEQHARVAFMLPLYYLQRGRVAEALHAYSKLKEAFHNVAETPEQAQRRQQLEDLLASAAKLLPPVQQGLVLGAPNSTSPRLALAQASSAPQGTQSILSGIQNLHLQSRGPTLISRQQGQLHPPLLTSTIQPYNAALPNLDQPQAPATLLPQSSFVSPKGISNRSRQLVQSASKGIRPSSLVPSALLSAKGPLSQPLTRTGTPGLLARKAGITLAQTPVTKVQSQQQEAFATPQAAEQEYGTPGTLTQDEWNAMMQTSGEQSILVSLPLNKGKKGFRPAMKKQRISTEFPNL